MVFKDRHHAGRELAGVLGVIPQPVIVYALPRGGVPVAVEIARALNADMDMVIARKIGHPRHPEYAIGAVTETGHPVYNDAECRRLGPDFLIRETTAQRLEACRRRELYCAGHRRRRATGKGAILVDDGLATGLTMQAAIKEIQADNPARLIVAVPVAPRDIADAMAGMVDQFTAVCIPAMFAGAVGSYYEDFSQLSDEDVIEELNQFHKHTAN